MKQGSNTRGRPRGRVGGGGGGNKRTPNRNQTFDSNGPSVRLRGNAMQLVEKYTALARDTGSQGDRVLSENYLQHADHYYRVYMALTGQTDTNRPGAPQPVRTNEDGDDLDTVGDPSHDGERPRHADRDDGREPRDRSRGGNGSTRPGPRPTADRNRNRDSDRDRDQDDMTEGALALLPSSGTQGGEARHDGPGDDTETAASDQRDAASATDATVVDGVRATLGLDRPGGEATPSESGSEQAPRRRRPARRAPRADTADESTANGSDGEAGDGDGEAAPRPRGRGRRGPRRTAGSAGEGTEAGGGEAEGGSDSRLL